MSRGKLVLLAIVAAGCFAVALSYPIRYWMADRNTAQTVDQLIALRDAALESQRDPTSETEATKREAAGPEVESTALRADGAEMDEVVEAPERTPAPLPAQAAEAEPASEETAEIRNTHAAAAETEKEREPKITESAATAEESGGGTQAKAASKTAEAVAPNPVTTSREAKGPAATTAAPAATNAPAATRVPMETSASALTPVATLTPASTPTPAPTQTPVPAPTFNRFARVGALSYPQKEKRALDESRILPQYREIYKLNPDFVGWITIPGTEIDYPVVQTQNSEFYLKHGFFGEENSNGQIILDSNCDPYTPSYNLVISGHNMRSGQMFGNLKGYQNKSYWSNHRIVRFDTLMEQKVYVAFAAFYSADYDVYESGFRYNVDVQYRLDTEMWLKEIESNKLYDTGIDVEFGDEFLTLTTCNKLKRKDGRFVVICRRIREGETFA